MIARINKPQLAAQWARKQPRVEVRKDRLDSATTRRKSIKVSAVFLITLALIARISFCFISDSENRRHFDRRLF